MSCKLTESERSYELHIPTGYWVLDSMPDFSYQDWIIALQFAGKSRQMSPALAQKIVNSLMRMPELGKDQKCLVSYSGKDSQCVAMLAAMKYPRDRVELVFADTKDEWQETIEFQPVFAEWIGLDLHVLDTPGLHGLIRERGFFPKPNKRWCTKELKMLTQRDRMDRLGYDQVRKDNKPAQFRDAYGNKLVDVKFPAPITMAGERWSESEARSNLPFDERTVELLRWTHRPVLDWTINDVWDFIFWMQSPYNPVYLIVDRVACAGCMFADKEEFRLLGMHHPEHLKQWAETEEIVGVDFSPSKKFSLRALYAEMQENGELGSARRLAVEEEKDKQPTPVVKETKAETKKQKEERVKREVDALLPANDNNIPPRELAAYLRALTDEREDISIDALSSLYKFITDLEDYALQEEAEELAEAEQTKPAAKEMKKPHQYTLKEFVADLRWEPRYAGKSAEGRHYLKMPNGEDWPGGLVPKGKTPEAVRKQFHAEQVFWKVHWPTKGDLVRDEVLQDYPYLWKAEQQMRDIMGRITINGEEAEMTVFNDTFKFNIMDFPMRDRVSQRGFVSDHNLIPEHIKNCGDKNDFMGFDPREQVCTALYRMLWDILDKDHSPFFNHPLYSKIQDGDEIEYIDDNGAVVKGIVKQHPGCWGVVHVKVPADGPRPYGWAGQKHGLKPIYPSRLVTKELKPFSIGSLVKSSETANKLWEIIQYPDHKPGYCHVRSKTGEYQHLKVDTFTKERNGYGEYHPSFAHVIPHYLEDALEIYKDFEAWNKRSKGAKERYDYAGIEDWHLAQLGWKGTANWVPDNRIEDNYSEEDDEEDAKVQVEQPA